MNHLRQQHASKVALYKQVVQLLHDELDRMKEHWEGTAQVQFIPNCSELTDVFYYKGLK